MIGNHSKRAREVGKVGLLMGSLLLCTAGAVAQYGTVPGDLPPVPEGYGGYYHEQPNAPNVPARMGYRAGFEDGRRDRENGHSFRPTQDDHYHKVPDIKVGMSREEVKNLYRDAYVHGYEHGYGR